MTYQKPELMLVGAAQGLVLGTKMFVASFEDNPADPEVSRYNQR